MGTKLRGQDTSICIGAPCHSINSGWIDHRAVFLRPVLVQPDPQPRLALAPVADFPPGRTQSGVVAAYLRIGRHSAARPIARPAGAVSFQMANDASQARATATQEAKD